MRLFVALNLPAEERDRLYEAAAPLRATEFPFRWVAPAAIHLTLKFLGEVHREAIDRVRGVVRAVAAKAAPFEVSLGGFGAFPTLRRPRVLWAGVEPTPQLRSLKHDLEWELARLGFEREVRAFHPHLTLGREMTRAQVSDFRAFESTVAGLHYEGLLEVRTVEVMRTILSPKGARYEPIHGLRLGTASEGPVVPDGPAGRQGA